MARGILIGSGKYASRSKDPLKEVAESRDLIRFSRGRSRFVEGR